jgi:hypothetical protein
MLYKHIKIKTSGQSSILKMLRGEKSKILLTIIYGTKKNKLKMSSRQEEHC